MWENEVMGELVMMFYPLSQHKDRLMLNPDADTLCVCRHRPQWVQGLDLNERTHTHFNHGFHNNFSGVSISYFRLTVF